MYEHKEFTFSAEFECGVCGKRFPMYYINDESKKALGYWGNRGRYNWMGARANFNRHIKACEQKTRKQQV